MKKSNLIISFLLSIFLFDNNIFGQCSANMNVGTGSGGVASFYSTSTGTNMTTSYIWNYGDGSSTGSGFSTSHTYTANGIYTVTLTIINTTPSCTSAATQTINITNANCALSPNSANYVYSSGSNGLVNFISTSTGTNSGSLYTWDFDNGLTGTGANTSHTYTNNGIYYVKLLVTNSASCKDSVYNFVNVNSLPCTLIANFTYTLANNGLVHFNSTSTGTNNGNASYTWNKNNIGFSNTPMTSNTFTNGTYTISLMVANGSPSLGCVSTNTQVITVNSNTCNIISSFSFTQNSGGNVNFISTSTGTSVNTTYLWNFGDGNVVLSTSNVNHIYSNSGLHNVKLVLQESNFPQCKDSISSFVNVTTAPCNANSNFTLTQISPGNWQATPAYPYNVSNATWSWGDGTFSNNLITSHTYSPTGLYNICLTVSVTCGGTSTSCATYSITRTSSSLSMATVNVVMPQAIVTSLQNNFFKPNDKVLVFPNPSNGIVYLSSIEDAQMEIFNQLGQKINEINLNEGNDRKQELKNFDTGAYIILIKVNNQISYKKIIITN